MADLRPLARCALLLVVLASTAEAAPRRGGWYWWWLRQQAAVREQATPVPATESAAQLASLAPVPEVPPSAPQPQEVVAAPVTTASLFAGVAPAEVAPLAISPIAEASWYSFAPSPVAPTFAYDAFINFGSGPYAGASALTTGGAQPWYTSPVVQEFYGGTPDDHQQAEFTSSVLQRVEKTFQDSGVAVSVTTNPADSAAHSLSVVSGTAYAQSPDAIGIADMGNDGFSFIDKLSYADSVDQLQWAVAHNVAHEMMHTFGVEHHDTTGAFLDGAVASWDMLIDPQAVFSTEAVADLLKQDFKTRFSMGSSGAQGLDVHPTGLVAPSPVPEPTTWAIWGVACAVGVIVRRRLTRGEC
jgi:hypothetical protein